MTIYRIDINSKVTKIIVIQVCIVKDKPSCPDATYELLHKTELTHLRSSDYVIKKVCLEVCYSAAL